MLNLTNTTIYRYFDKKLSGFLEKPFDWQDSNDVGLDDFLFRTSLGYIAYYNSDSSDRLYKGMIDCFDDNGKAYRNPLKDEDTVSRDQVIMFLTAMKINVGMAEFKGYALGLKYRLSKRYTMTPGMWLWIRVLAKKQFYGLFALVFGIELLITVYWRKLVNWIWGIHSIDINDLLEDVGSKNASQILFEDYVKKVDKHLRWKLYKFIKIPYYSIHLSVWMIFVLPEGRIKRILQMVIRKAIPKQNLLLRLLTNQEVFTDELQNYKPMYRYAWSTEFNCSEWYSQLKGDDAKFNTIDEALLFRILIINQV